MQSTQEKDYTKLTTSELVDEWIALDTAAKVGKKRIDIIKAEIEARGTSDMDTRNTRFVQYFGDNGSVSITDSYKLCVLNEIALHNVLGTELVAAQATTTTKTTYTYKTKFEKALKAAITGDYSYEYTLEDFLREQVVKDADTKKLKLLLKSLKGDYEKDLKVLQSVLGDRSYDEELMYIHLIKNAELISAYIPDNTLAVLGHIRKYAIVEISTGVTLRARDDVVSDDCTEK